MANLAKKKVLSAPFANEKEMVRVEWDFDVDGGAVATYEMLEAEGVMAVRMVHAYVMTAVTSGGSATFDVGVEAGSEFLSNTAVASLTAGALIDPATQAFKKLTDGQSLDFKIEVAAATAGKVAFILEIIRLA